MGAGIAQLVVQSGLEARLCDVSDAVLSKAEDRILRGLERAEMPGAFSLLRKTTQLEKLAPCELVIEAAYEDMAVKRDLFRRLDDILPPPRILATNTSSLTVSGIAAATENPQRVVGLHFFNPAPIMRLVEVVRGAATSEETVADVKGLAEK